MPNKYVQAFFDNMRALGMFVRDYDAATAKRLPDVAHDLHFEMSKLDCTNFRGWQDVTLLQFINAYAEANPGLRIHDREEA